MMMSELEVEVVALSGEQVFSMRLPSDSTLKDLRLAMMQDGIASACTGSFFLSGTTASNCAKLAEHSMQGFCQVQILKNAALPEPDAQQLERQRAALELIAAGTRLSELGVESRNNTEVVLAAVTEDVTNLRYASERFRRDVADMLAAVQINSLAHCYVHRDLWSNRDFALGAVKASGDLLEFVDSQFKDDTEIVLAALEQDGHLLKHASFARRCLREVALAAVRQKGTALCYVADLLKEDREIALTAVRQNGMAFCHVGPGLKRDPEVREATRYQDGQPVFKGLAVLQRSEEERLDNLEQSVLAN